MDIREKITEFIENIDEQHLYYLFGGVLLFVFLVDYFLLMNPQLAMLSKINPDIKILRTDIQKVKKDIKEIEQYRKNADEMQKKMDDVGQRVLSREELPIVLEYISLLANQNNINIDQIVPNPSHQQPLLVNNTKEYFTLPIEVRGRGGYHNFGRFLNKMETGDFDLRIGTFSITGKQDGMQTPHEFQLTVLAVLSQNTPAGGAK